MTWAARRLLLCRPRPDQRPAAELRLLRGHVGPPLAELVAESNECSAWISRSPHGPVPTRPRPAPTWTLLLTPPTLRRRRRRADPRRVPCLSDGRQSEEFGLEAGRVGDTDSVKLAPCTRPRDCNGRPCLFLAWPWGCGPRCSRPSPGSRPGGRTTRADPVQPAGRRGGPARAGRPGCRRPGRLQRAARRGTWPRSAGSI